MTKMENKLTKSDVLTDLGRGLYHYDPDDCDDQGSHWFKPDDFNEKFGKLKNDPRIDGLVKWANKYRVAWECISAGMWNFSVSDKNREKLLELGEKYGK